MEILVQLILLIARILMLIIFVSALLSFFVSPYHPVREALDRITAPLLDPIRRRMPSTGPVDFSPLVLILLIQLVTFVIIQVFLSA